MFHWKNKVDHDLLPFREIEYQRPLAKPKRIARSYSSFKDGKSQQISAGILSAFKAAVHYQEACSEVYSDVSRDIAFFIPIVVVDGELYDCFLDDASELAAEPVSALVYRQNYHTEGYGRVSNWVTVITVSALPSYIADLQKWGEHILSIMKENRGSLDE